MARLYEYQSKILLKEGGVAIPQGEVASTPKEARAAAERIGKAVVIKMQVWVTGRAGLGGIQFAESPDEAEAIAREMLGKTVKNFVVDKVLVEEKLDIKAEYFAGLVIDDARKCPLLVFSSVGGTGIEEIAQAHPEKISKMPVDILAGLREYQVRNLIRQTGISGKPLVQLSSLLTRFYKVAQTYDARSAEMNPLVLTEDGKVYAADCHFTVDDYAVFRHPDLGIEVVREFDRPPTELERIAYQVEEKDHRGTFYFLQMIDEVSPDDLAIGFNGAGGGGSMMSMDAVLGRGFKLANYCDTSGNPAAAKVYRAAKIILSQPHIKGYFASGSGVASQEQYHSARGLVKAFYEEQLEIPGVIRLGGNFEEKAIEILGTYLKDIPGEVEGYGRDDSPEFCARRMEELIQAGNSMGHRVRPIEVTSLPEEQYSFDILTGKLFIDQDKCRGCQSKGCVEACPAGILAIEDGRAVLAISREDAKKGKCTECLACEIFCKFHERDAIFIHLPIPGLIKYRDSVINGLDPTSDPGKDR
ncbi:MAG: 4Fe-4S dicluster domain-containing protein [Candidatus Aminicenantes bacterium]|nr:4Fe-4S dicluster domain-containing protein [Candidatus Aminicenantes bacterium]